MFQGPIDYSIVKKAIDKKQVEINLVNIRDFGKDRHKQVDDTPYGGGTGMILRVDVLCGAITNTKRSYSSSEAKRESRSGSRQARTINKNQKVVLLSASGKKFTQQKAQEFAKVDHLILVCGHYEGVDGRIKKYIDEEISIGDFITTGGEIPSMLIIDCVIRLLPGIFKEGVTENESFSLTDEKKGKYLEYPQYTKPAIFDNLAVPEVLLSGNHKRIQEWRTEQALEKTKKFRPDLLNLSLRRNPS